MAEVLSAVTGRDIRHVDVDPAVWRAHLLAAGVPADRADFLDAMFTAIRNGHEDVVNDGVERALGRAPTSFVDWARREAPAAAPAG